MLSRYVEKDRVFVNQGITIYEACQKNGIEISHFCYHERRGVAGNCRMCLVEVEGGRKPIPSCVIPATEGRKVYRNTPRVKKAREGVMEFRLMNHPRDCPICDQGGECDLQDQSMEFGSDRSRNHEIKRTVEDKDLGNLVATVMTRCIHCTRCVRFSSRSGMSSLGMIGRGNQSEIGTYDDEGRNGYRKGNRADLCPVGALTTKPNAYQARSWERKGLESVDTRDGLGNQIRREVRGNQILRIRPGRDREWLGDKSRFALDGNQTNRVGTDPRLTLDHLNQWISERMKTPTKGRRSSSMDTTRLKRIKERELISGEKITLVHSGTETLTKERRHQGETRLPKGREKRKSFSIGLNRKEELPRRNLRKTNDSSRSIGNGSNQRSPEAILEICENPSETQDIDSTETIVRIGSAVWTRKDGAAWVKKLRNLVNHTNLSVGRIQHRANTQGIVSIGFSQGNSNDSKNRIAFGVDSGEITENGDWNRIRGVEKRARRRSSHENWRVDSQRKVGMKTSMESSQSRNSMFGKLNWTHLQEENQKEIEGNLERSERMNDEGVGRERGTESLASIETGWNTLRTENRYDYHTEGHSRSRVSLTRSNS